MSSIYDSPKKGDLSISDILDNFDKLRVSALTKAAEISPSITECTIGPNSPIKKEIQEPQIFIPSPSAKVKNKENLTSDLLSNDLRYTLLARKYEAKQQEDSELMFKNLLEKMISKRAEVMQKFGSKQSEECERKALELKARKLKMLKQLYENDNMSVLEMAKMENNVSINRQAIDNMNKLLEEQNIQTARFAAITDSHTKICITYNELNTLFQSNDIASKLFPKYNSPLSDIITNINMILDECKKNSMTDKKVKQAELLVHNMNNLKDKIIEDMSNLLEQEKAKVKKEKEEAELKKQMEDKIKQEEIEAEKVKQTQVQQQGPAKPMFYSQTNITYYEELKNFLTQYENLYKDLLADVSLKKFKFDCQKAVNIPVNAISSVNGAHIRDKYEKLSKLLRGERVQVLDMYVQATQHPQGLFYVTSLLAKKIVRQGDLLVSSNPEAAFPLASVTVALWTQFPQFGKLLEAYFHRECPYLVPMFLPQKQGQTDKDFYKSRGYTYNDEGEVEKQDKFLKRMSGIFRLRCAIWIARTPSFLNVPNTHGLKYGWQWLASFINLKPEPDICATLLLDFFNMCGTEFFKCYGRQFTKIIKLICTEYLKILENIDEGGPKTRLEVFLQDVLKTGHIPPPEGMLSPNLW